MKAAFLFIELVHIQLQHCSILNLIILWVNLSSSYAETNWSLSKRWGEMASGIQARSAVKRKIHLDCLWRETLQRLHSC